MKICTVDGCASKVKARGLCTKHYQRLMKRGATGPSAPRTKGAWQATDLELAYIAAFMDGEGTIGVKKFVRPENTFGYCYTPYLSASNTDPLIPTWLFSIFGGRLRERPSKEPNTRLLYCWEVSAKAAVAAVIMIRPFLRMKCAQADILISEFRERKYVGGRKAYAPEYWEYLEEVYQRLRKLNRRGRQLDESE